MKKLYCSILALGCAIGTQAQILFNMLGPQNVAGNYEITWTEIADGWGTVDLNDPANAVTDTLAFVDDGTTADSLGCEALVNGPAISGKIAVVYRGTCEFGVKALNAQDQGAVAVIIINNISGAPVGMGAGAQGANVTIPVVMISDADGAFLKQDIINGNAVGFIGTVTDLYTDDVGFFRTDVLLPRYGANPLLLSANNSEYNFSLGVKLTNFGSNDQTGITVTADVSQDGNSVFSVTSDPIDLLSNDSLWVDLGLFELPTYDGDYTLTYSAQMAATDLFTLNNSYSTTFSFGDIFSYAPLDFGSHLPISSTHVPGTVPGTYQLCVHFRDANASRVGSPGVWFSAVPTVLGEPIEGTIFEVGAYKWIDDFTGMVDVVSPPTLELMNATEFSHPNVAAGTMVYAPFLQSGLPAPVLLENDQRYLFCVTSFTDLVRVGYNSVLQYDRTQALYDQPITQYYDGGALTWYVGGFTGGGTSSMGVVMLDAETIGINEQEANAAPAFPNPARDEVRIPVPSPGGAADVRVIDAQGRLISSQRTSITGGQLIISTVDIVPGTYRIEVTPAHGQPLSFPVVVSR